MGNIVGLIAGAGRLPPLIAKALEAHGRSFVVLSYAKSSDQGEFCGVPCRHLSLGQVGAALAFLKDHGVGSLVMAGAFQRPAFKGLKVDLKGAAWLSGLLKEPSGDDHLLRYLTRKLEGEGFSVISPQSIMPHALHPPGLLAGEALSPSQMTSVARGFQLLSALSPFDVGQALALEEDWILSIEGAEGTDALIKRTKALMRTPGAAFLLKAPKEGQDLRLDPPVLGLDTLSNLLQNGFRGVVFKAPGTLLLEPLRMQAFARENGLIVFGVDDDMLRNTGVMREASS